MYSSGDVRRRIDSDAGRRGVLATAMRPSEFETSLKRGVFICHYVEKLRDHVLSDARPSGRMCDKCAGSTCKVPIHRRPKCTQQTKVRVFQRCDECHESGFSPS